jgi:hypothetical protein
MNRIRPILPMVLAAFIGRAAACRHAVAVIMRVTVRRGDERQPYLCITKSIHACLALLAAIMLPCMPSRAAVPASAPIQRQIDALLKYRLRPEPLPVDPPNPFVVVTGNVRETGADTIASKLAVKPGDDPKGGVPALIPPADVAGMSDADVLGICAGRLKIGGLMRLKDQMQVVINDVPRREADSVAVYWNNGVIALRITRIQPGLVTFRYGEAEVSVKF